jgi:hypothetical protein
MWPGVLEDDKTYRDYLLTDQAKAVQFLTTHPSVMAYRQWARSILTGATKAATAPTAAATQPGVPTDYMARLLGDYYRTGTMSPTLRTALEKLYKKQGQTIPFEQWVETMRPNT